MTSDSHESRDQDDLPATLTLTQAAERAWDAVVVGAGPAGALAARELARRRLTVLLVEKARFPRPKVCGGCLNGAALGALEAVGLRDLPTRLGAPAIRSVQLVAKGRSAVLSLPEGASVSRFALDAALAREAIAEGAHFLPGTVAALDPLPAANLDGTEPPSCGPSRVVRLQQPTGEVRVTARAVVAADGLAGRIASDEPGFERSCSPDSYLGAGTILDAATFAIPDNAIVMNWGRAGYVGIVRVEGGQVDVAAALSPGLVKATGGLGAAAASILAEAGSPARDAAAQARWRGTPTLTRRLAKTAGDRLFVLGDAAGYVEPFTGEGMGWALSSAAWMGPALAEWLVVDGSLAERGRDASVERDAQRRAFESAWQRGLSRFAANRTWTCRAVKQLLRRPMLVGWAIRAVQVAPWLARWAVAAVNTPARSNDFAIPAIPRIGVP